MPIVKTETVTCDRCGRGPSSVDDNCWDHILYGWVIVEITSLCKEPIGHNQIDGKSPLILCDQCRRKKIPELTEEGSA